MADALPLPRLRLPPPKHRFQFYYLTCLTPCRCPTERDAWRLPIPAARHISTWFKTSRLTFHYRIKPKEHGPLPVYRYLNRTAFRRRAPAKTPNCDRLPYAPVTVHASHTCCARYAAFRTHTLDCDVGVMGLRAIASMSHQHSNCSRPSLEPLVYMLDIEWITYVGQCGASFWDGTARFGRQLLRFTELVDAYPFLRQPKPCLTYNNTTTHNSTTTPAFPYHHTTFPPAALTRTTGYLITPT